MSGQDGINIGSHRISDLYPTQKNFMGAHRSGSPNLQPQWAGDRSADIANGVITKVNHQSSQPPKVHVFQKFIEMAHDVKAFHATQKAAALSKRVDPFLESSTDKLTTIQKKQIFTSSLPTRTENNEHLMGETNKPIKSLTISKLLLVTKELRNGVKKSDKLRNYNDIQFFRMGKGIIDDKFKVEPLTTDKITLKAWTTDSQGLLIQDEISPTISSKGKLTNIYTTNVGDVTVIRSGVIDTPEKKAEFVAIVNELRKTSPERPLRVVSNQLNSPEKESQLIFNQHRGIEELGDSYIHINTPSNAFYKFTMMSRKLGSIGKLIENLLLKGEKKSHDNNLSGLVKYATWLSEDMKGQEFFKDFNSNNQEITDLRFFLRRNGILPNVKKYIEKSLKVKELQLLNSQFENLGKLIGDSSVPYEMKQKMALFHAVLGCQLRKPEFRNVSRGQEIMMFQILNDSLGAISAINCKSGLDRTGLVHAAKLGFLQAVDLGQMSKEESINLVLQWDEITTKMNAIIAKFGIDLFKQLLKYNDYEALDIQSKDITLMKQVNIVRENIFKILIETGLPITAESTGLIGLKWHKGVSENPIVGNFLPSHINIGGTEELVPILTYSKSGQYKGLTQTGQDIFLQYSAGRGA